MAALAFTPVFPMAEQQVIVDARLHLALFFLFVALAVAGVVLAIEIHGRSKCYGLSVRRPLKKVGARRKCRQFLRFAAFHRKQVHLRIAVARRQKRQRLSVWRPRGRTIVPALRHLHRVAARCAYDPYIARVAVGFHVRGGHRKGRPLPIGGNLRGRDAMQFHHVVKRDGMFRRRLCVYRTAYRQRHQCHRTDHSQQFHRILLRPYPESLLVFKTWNDATIPRAHQSYFLLRSPLAVTRSRRCVPYSPPPSSPERSQMSSRSRQTRFSPSESTTPPKTKIPSPRRYMEPAIEILPFRRSCSAEPARPAPSRRKPTAAKPPTARHSI